VLFYKNRRSDREFAHDGDNSVISLQDEDPKSRSRLFMNRLQMHASELSKKTPVPQQSTKSASSYVIEQAMARSHAEGQYSVFAPMHYEANYAYPLLVWLHGPGDDEQQLQRVMPFISMRNYVAVSPRGVTALIDRAGFAWDGDEDATLLAQQRILEAVEQVKKRFHVDASRIFLAGLQCGGSMAMRLGLRRPRDFAGVASLGGAFPAGRMPLRDLSGSRHLPMFLAHNRDSKHYSEEQSCLDLRLMHAAGMHITLRQYPCGDELTTKMLQDLDAWMMELVTGSRSSSEDLSWFEDAN
jgi:phospholipase/carboxylesterase